MGIYLICPVRKLEDKEKKLLDAYVKKTRQSGQKIKCPYEDTDQDDEVGLKIVNEHENDILENEFIHIWWNPKSRGSIWDIAQVKLAQYLLESKKLVFLNKDPDIQNFSYIYEKEPVIDVKKLHFSIVWKDDNRYNLYQTLWKMGQIRMFKRLKRDITIDIENLAELEVDPFKSYKNVSILTVLDVDDYNRHSCKTRDDLRELLKKEKERRK